MMYLIYSIEQDAINRSEQIAVEQGCNEDITKYWFGWIISYSNPPETALTIPDDQIDKLTLQEQSNLKDQTYMDSNGWFEPTI